MKWRLTVSFKVEGKIVGTVEVKEFMNSGEVPNNLILKEAIEYFNGQERNIADGVTAVCTVGTNDEEKPEKADME